MTIYRERVLGFIARIIAYTCGTGALVFTGTPGWIALLTIGSIGFVVAATSPPVFRRHTEG